jgi:hypothetical protein
MKISTVPRMTKAHDGCSTGNFCSHGNNEGTTSWASRTLLLGIGATVAHSLHCPPLSRSVATTLTYRCAFPTAIAEEVIMVPRRRIDHCRFELAQRRERCRCAHPQSEIGPNGQKYSLALGIDHVSISFPAHSCRVLREFKRRPVDVNYEQNKDERWRCPHCQLSVSFRR